MTTTMKRLEPGDRGEVRYANRYQGNPRPAVVEKVGRRWATLKSEDGRHDMGRCDATDYYLDGGQFSSPGRFVTPELAEYLSRMDEALKVIRDGGFQLRLGSKPPEDTVLAVADLLSALNGIAVAWKRTIERLQRS